MFDKNQFDQSYKVNIERLAASEKITKELLRSMSRDVLEAHHVTGDVAYINGLIAVLSPTNKKVCILFYKEFSGHTCNEEGVFGKKDKKKYEESRKASFDQLEDPLFNVFSWADRHVEIEKKPFTLGKLQQQMCSLVKKAEENKIPHSDIIRALFANGVEVKEFLKVVEHMAEEQQPADGPALVDK